MLEIMKIPYVTDYFTSLKTTWELHYILKGPKYKVCFIVYLKI